MDDLISRQAAINETWRELRYTDALNALTEIRERIRSLPSAGPDLQPTCNQLATDCISRKAAIDAVHKSILGFFDICDDDEETPMTDKDNLLLEINKAITTRLKAVASAQQDISLWFRIAEICVDESKGFISGGRAVEKIREVLREAEP